ncbi:hypothetical protein CRENBAI_020923 [Crenichthys baileyi]|uniref:Uncharacterized protein n=1 Tax=Crenichthys baileyi TaxID=28760 RepID=A0AAV9RWT8_9TELE
MEEGKNICVSVGRVPAAIVQKPQGAVATSPQAPSAAINVDPAMDPETQDPGTYHSPSRGPTEPRGPGPSKATPNQDTDIEHMPLNPNTMNTLPTAQGHNPTGELHPRKADEATPTHIPAPSTPMASCPTPQTKLIIVEMKHFMFM